MGRKIRLLWSISRSMSRFWTDAMQVLETASRAARDEAPADLAVILDAAGGLRIVAAEGWSTEGLRSEYGGTVYHVTRTGRDVCVEGRAAGMSCTLRGPFTGSPLPRALPPASIDHVPGAAGYCPSRPPLRLA